MVDFIVDESDVVHGVIASDGDLCAILKSDLDPFDQGYIEELLKDAPAVGPMTNLRLAVYSDLSPEALEQIRKDCMAFRKGRSEGAPAGRSFYRTRQQGAWGREFPPFASYLVDGKLHLEPT